MLKGTEVAPIRILIWKVQMERKVQKHAETPLRADPTARFCGILVFPFYMLMGCQMCYRGPVLIFRDGLYVPGEGAINCLYRV